MLWKVLQVRNDKLSLQSSELGVHLELSRRYSSEG